MALSDAERAARARARRRGQLEPSESAAALRIDRDHWRDRAVRAEATLEALIPRVTTVTDRDVTAVTKSHDRDVTSTGADAGRGRGVASRAAGSSSISCRVSPASTEEEGGIPLTSQTAGAAAASVTKSHDRDVTTVTDRDVTKDPIEAIFGSCIELRDDADELAMKLRALEMTCGRPKDVTLEQIAQAIVDELAVNAGITHPLPYALKVCRAWLQPGALAAHLAKREQSMRLLKVAKAGETGTLTRSDQQEILDDLERRRQRRAAEKQREGLG